MDTSVSDTTFGPSDDPGIDVDLPYTITSREH